MLLKYKLLVRNLLFAWVFAAGLSPSFALAPSGGSLVPNSSIGATFQSFLCTTNGTATTCPGSGALICVASGNNSACTIPATTSGTIFIDACGGGGGGGSGQQSVATAGGSGGSGAPCVQAYPLGVLAGETLTIFAGPAGAGGTTVNGFLGGTTTITGAQTAFPALTGGNPGFVGIAGVGGAGNVGGGIGGSAGGAGGAAGSPVTSARGPYYAAGSGSGGGGATAGSPGAGGSNVAYLGGTAGSGNGAGGGGGSSIVCQGGTGGAPAAIGLAPIGANCFGGGGGGGGDNAAGGAGAPGEVRVYGVW